MKWNGVKRTTPKVWLGKSLRVVWELYVYDTFLIYAMCHGGLVVIAHGPCSVLLVSHLADTESFLLLCLVGQLKRCINWIIVVVHIVGSHSFMVNHWRLSRRYWNVPRDVSIRREGSTSHPIKVVRSQSWLNVHLHTIRKHGWYWWCLGIIHCRKVGVLMREKQFICYISNRCYHARWW